MDNLSFRRITLADKALIQSFTFTSESQNCDLNFMNLCSWQFLYDTEFAIMGKWLIFRFYAGGHLAYMLPKQKGDPHDILQMLLEDCSSKGHPFLLLGVCENCIGMIDRSMPNFFRFTHNRDYTDYIYDRATLETLAGRHLQSKRNHINKFLSTYPDYRYCELTPELIPQCRALESQWKSDKQGNVIDRDYENERRSMNFVFDHWAELDAIGGCIFIGNSLAAFTFGAAINGYTFDVCVEKADTKFEGSYTIINRDFVRSLPPKYKYINREEDLGIEGLRRAKLSYKPSILLHKYSVMQREPLNDEHEFLSDND